MTHEAGILLDFIQDHTNNDSNDLVFHPDDVTEIPHFDEKQNRLLKELKTAGYIKEFHTESSGSLHITTASKKAENEFTMQQQSADPENQSSRKKNRVNPKRNQPLLSIHEFVMSHFIKKKHINIDNDEHVLAYSDLFKYFVRITTDSNLEVRDADNLFSFIKDKINERNDENYIKILGPDGTGKSTFLQILYIYLYHYFYNNLITDYPFYINLHYYDQTVVEADSVDELNKKAEKKIEEDLSSLIEFSKRNKQTHFLIIIDGNDRYVRTNLRTSHAISNILKRIKGHKKIICLGEKTNVHSYREKSGSNSDIDQPTTYTFYFSPIYINKKEIWKEVIAKYCQLFCENKKEIILNCIERFRIKEIDYNLLTIFCDCNDLDSIGSISQLYEKYCLNYLGMSDSSLSKSTEMSHTYFMTNEPLNQQEISENWKEWELVHQHKTISNYLLARFYANLILNGLEENGTKPFECVFTNGINIFLKAIVNENKDYQKKTLAFCQFLFTNGGFRAKSQAAYLAGRITDSNLKEKSTELLKANLASFKKTKHEKDKRKEYFYQRTILVSLLYLGEAEEGERLLNLLFKDKLFNEVNRAFYLQYYDDVKSEPEFVHLKDNGKDNIFFTMDVLLNYINTQLLVTDAVWPPKNSFEFQIHLFTLCSLILERLNKPEKDSYINKLSDVLQKTLDTAQSNLEPDMLTYLKMLQEDINDKINIGHLYDELYRLKDVQRSGWLKKIKKGSILDDRYENVAEHTYYTWLLGMLFLPDERPKETKYSKYNKQKILDCLLIHDLAEAYTGDLLPEERTEVHKKHERDHMRKIFMHEKYSHIGNMNSYWDIWQKFDLNSSDINGKIAKELDIIQAIYQFCVYKQKGAIFEDQKEQEWKKEVDKVKTGIGKQILHEVVLKKFKDIL